MIETFYRANGLPESVTIDGYEYYWSTCHNCYIILSPVSGLVGGYLTEPAVLSFIRREIAARPPVAPAHRGIHIA